MTGGWAQLEWRDGRPFSREFNDVYFCGDGLDEVEHVFLRPAELAQRFSEGGQCRIGELGFGTGLNFLCTLKMFIEYGAEDAELEYTSCERFPLTAEDIDKSLMHLASLNELTESLVTAYPVVASGAHRLDFASGKVRLNLHFDAAQQALPDYPEDINIWFLDGFAPDRNPDMWLHELMAEVGRHSAAGATLSTFTSSGTVKKALRGAGFQVNRKPGYGRKRHMLFACKEDASP